MNPPGFVAGALEIRGLTGTVDGFTAGDEETRTDGEGARGATEGDRVAATVAAAFAGEGSGEP